jgi:hypothetical protein
VVLDVVRKTCLIFAAVFAFTAQAALAEVHLTFWSRDMGGYFPHAFITLKGRTDGSGEVIDTSYGFTLNNLGPAALLGSVKAHIDITAKSYMRGSDAHFSLVINDAQVAAIQQQAAEWGAPGSRWNLNRRNCVHFVAEAARRAGLTVVENKKLMKKPKSFTLSLLQLNRGRVTEIGLRGQDYWTKFPETEIFGVPERIGGSVLNQPLRTRTAPEPL